MNTKDNRQNAHDMIDRIFHDLLPAHGMAERPDQVSLSHLMLDARDIQVLIRSLRQEKFLLASEMLAEPPARPRAILSRQNFMPP